MNKRRWSILDVQLLLIDLIICNFTPQQKFVRCSVRAEVRHLRKVLCHRLNVEKHQVSRRWFSNVHLMTQFLLQQPVGSKSERSRPDVTDSPAPLIASQPDWSNMVLNIRIYFNTWMKTLKSGTQRDVKVVLVSRDSRVSGELTSYAEMPSGPACFVGCSAFSSVLTN